MSLNEVHAKQIAALLNERNKLTQKYTSQKIIDGQHNYLYRVSELGEVVACVEIKKVQWYQSEVLHLAVGAEHVRKGHAKALLMEAENVARKNGACILQCTIREDNQESLKLFESFDFKPVNLFGNSESGNNVAVLQKVLSSPKLSRDKL
jgi:ribosomal protein S18 acetylase RimI-like enzyme